MSSTGWPHMLALFAEELDDLADRLDRAFAALTEDPANRAVLDDVVSVTHTIKGSASMLALRTDDARAAGALDAMSTLARLLGERAKAALGGTDAIDGDLLATLRDVPAILRVSVPDLAPADVERIAGKILAIGAHRTADESGGDVVLDVLAALIGNEEPATAPPASEPESGPSDIAVVPDEIYALFVEETAGVLTRVTGLLAQLETEPESREALTELRRAVHTIKGSSRMLGYESLGRLGQRCEDLAEGALEAGGAIEQADIALYAQAVGWFSGATARIAAREPAGDPPLDLLAAFDERRDSRALLRAAPIDAAPADPMRAIFLEEERQLLDALNLDLVALEKDPRATDLIHAVLRATHTLKGSAAMLGFERTRTVAHRMEDVLQMVRDGDIALDSNAIDMLLGAADLIDRLGGEIARTGAESTGTVETVARLDALRARLEGDIVVPAADAAPESAAEPKPPEMPIADGLRDVYIHEARGLIETLGQELVRLEGEACDSDTLNRAFRAAHTMKGSAAMMGHERTRALAHALEDALHAVRDGRLTVTAEIVDTLLQATDGIERLVGAVEVAGIEPDDPTVERVTTALRALPLDAAPAASEVPWTEAGHEHLTALTRALIALELDPADGDARKRFADAVAELAIAATVAGERVVERVCRALSTLLAGAAPREPLDAQTIAALNESAEVVGAVIAGREPVAAETDALVARVAEIRGRLTIAPPPAPETPVENAELTEEERRAAERRGRPRIVEVDLDRLNRLMNLAAELVISRTRLSTELERLSGIVGELDAQGRALRDIETRIARLKARESPDRSRDERVLRNFSEAEFDRFSAIDILTRDLRESAVTVAELSGSFAGMASGFDQNITRISTIAKDLHDEILRVRMVRMDRAFARIPRIVRDAARSEGKQVELTIEGIDTEIDKNILEALNDPLLHLVRNSVSHGLETPDERLLKRKPPAGRVTVRAWQDGNQVILEASDDGRGIDPARIRRIARERGIMPEEQALGLSDAEAINLIFEPGFSTSDTVSEMSGRGVGLDVVRSVVTRFNGTVSVDTAIDRGTTFRIALPLTLAIGQALLVEIVRRPFALPIGMIAQIEEIQPDEVAFIREKPYIYRNDVPVPLVILGEALRLPDVTSLNGRSMPVVLVRSGERQVAFAVDRIIGQEDIVIKTLGGHLRRVPGISGATILGDGAVVMILNMAYFLSPLAGAHRKIAPPEARTAPAKSEARPQASELAIYATPTKNRPRPAEPRRRRTVLVVDDSISIRKYVSGVLERGGYGVVTANDGMDAWQKLQQNDIDLVISDLEMPRMHGYELIVEIKKSDRFRQIPVVFLTARAGEKHRRMGAELGAAAFLNKPFSEAELLRLMEEIAT